MRITGGCLTRVEYVATLRVSLCTDYESGGMYRIVVRDENTDESTTSELVDEVTASHMMNVGYDAFLDEAAEQLGVISLADAL